jgi:iron complex outermembrane receptor protein/vitamin B12 transporter
MGAVNVETTCLVRGRAPFLDAVVSFRRSSLLLFLLLAGASVSEMGAQEEPPLELPPFSVIGTHLAFFDDGSMDPVRLEVGGDWIGQTEPATTMDLFRSVPGLMVEQPAGQAGNGVLYLRGGDPNFTKVLVDGIEVNNPTDPRGGGFLPGAITPEAVDQVTILPGAQSAVHGSDALSGVVQIRTFPEASGGQESGGRAYSFLGTGSRASGGVSWQQAGPGILARVHLNRETETDLVPGNQFSATRFHAGLDWNSARDWDLRFAAFHFRTDRRFFPDDSGGPRYAVIREREMARQHQTGAMVRVAHPVGSQGSAALKMDYYESSDRFDSPGVAPGIRDPFGIPASLFDSTLERIRVHGIYRDRPLEELMLAIGGSYAGETGKSLSRVQFPFGIQEGRTERSVDTWSLFGEAAWEVADGHSLLGALRIDSVEALETVSTSRLAYRMRIGNQVRAQVSYGEGFKKPSFFALDNPVVGNPLLEAEESDLLEAALLVAGSSRRWTWRTSVFRQRFTNLIDLSESAPPRLVNLSEVISEGLTTRVRFEDERRGFLFSATWMDVEVPGSGELLRNRPEWNLATEGWWRLAENLRLAAAGRYVGDRLDSSVPTGTRRLGGYLVVDIRLQADLGENLEAILAVENLLDRSYEETVGTEGPGRGLRAGLRFAF